MRMTRFLGIDYGVKKIGLAVSGERGDLAFPHSVVPSDPSAIRKVAKIVRNLGVHAIVMGASLNLDRSENPVMVPARAFADALARETELRVYWQDERYTTLEAARIQGRHPKLDASAAALILQAYLDRNAKQ